MPDTIKASNDLDAKLFIHMHYGTFDPSDEPAGEPLRLLNGINKRKMLKAKLKVLNPRRNNVPAKARYIF